MVGWCLTNAGNGVDRSWTGPAAPVADAGRLRHGGTKGTLDQLVERRLELGDPQGAEHAVSGGSPRSHDGVVGDQCGVSETPPDEHSQEGVLCLGRRAGGPSMLSRMNFVIDSAVSAVRNTPVVSRHRPRRLDD